MVFNSFEFLLFFPIVCFIYYLLGKNRYRNPFLLVASYYFYMNWQPIYAVLILTSTVLSYVCGLLVEKHAGARKRQQAFLVAGLVLNFGILFTFKYFNFVNESLFCLMSYCGLRWPVPNLDVLLPVGISFYTFQAVGYSIDVYRGTIRAERNFFTYALFVSFFPQLVAGPIERAKNLLPQFHEEHAFDEDNVREGFKLMVWGYFMKLCVADVLSPYVDAVYNNVPEHNGTSMLLATLFFTIQIYCDFAGYSSIAIGAARVMGYRLMDNFRQPYFALDIKEFWKRWHISLSTWFMDYLYIPLGGNRVPYPRLLLNLAITFLVSGIWHGANWTFLLWGGVHAMYQVGSNMFRKFVYAPKYDVWWSRVLGTFSCFVAVAFAWIFFRANDISDAFTIIVKIFCDRGPLFVDMAIFVYGMVGIALLIIKDVRERFGIGLRYMHSKYVAVRYAAVVGLISYILLFGALTSGNFIYFQF